MDLNHLYSQHQLPLMRTDATSFHMDRNRQLDMAGDNAASYSTVYKAVTRLASICTGERQ